MAAAKKRADGHPGSGEREKPREGDPSAQPPLTVAAVIVMARRTDSRLSGI